MFRLISQFLAWWRAELVSFVPARLRAFFRQTPGVVVLDLRGGAVALRLWRNGDAGELGTIPLAEGSVAERHTAVGHALANLPGWPGWHSACRGIRC